MFDRLLSRFRGRRNWPSATASMVSATFHNTRSQDGSYEVAYTFWVEGHIYSGLYWERGSGSGDPYYLKPNDPITVQYNPQDPNDNFNPDYDNNVTIAPVVLGLAFVLGIVVVIVMAIEK